MPTAAVQQDAWIAQVADVIVRRINATLDRCVDEMLASIAAAKQPRKAVAPKLKAQSEADRLSLIFHASRDRVLAEDPEFVEDAHPFIGVSPRGTFAAQSDEDEPEHDDLPDTPAVRQLLAPFAHEGAEVLTAARGALREYGALRASSRCQLASMPVERFLAAHPQVAAARGDVAFR